MPPLNPATLSILLALAGEPRHGYAIMQEVTRQSGGRQKLGPGTLYDNLRKLLDEGWVAEATGKAAKDSDPRRRYYDLTPEGRAALAAEVERLEAVVRAAKAALRPARSRA